MDSQACQKVFSKLAERFRRVAAKPEYDGLWRELYAAASAAGECLLSLPLGERYRHLVDPQRMDTITREKQTASVWELYCSDLISSDMSVSDKAFRYALVCDSIAGGQ